MKSHGKIALAFFILLLAANGGLPHQATTQTAADNPNRIRFHVATVEENGGQRKVISETAIEGPPGTDFDINLRDERFKMSARFLTDLLDGDQLKVRAKLDTRRLYGYSERNLPLYEEDAQRETLQVGFDEAIVLLPFGRNGGDKLKIEITPERTATTVYLPSGKRRPLNIDILIPSPGGAINVQAQKQPHNFDVEIALLENGREVARGKGTFLLEEAQELTLQPNDQAGSDVAGNPLAVNLNIERFISARPFDQVVLNFDLNRIAAGNARETVARNWAGVSNLGDWLKYDLPDKYLKRPGRKYEITFKIKLAEGERVD